MTEWDLKKMLETMSLSEAIDRYGNYPFGRMGRGSSVKEHQACNLEGGGLTPSPGTKSAKIVLSGHQPVYLPGIIVFTKIALSDKFMFVGHCDYQPKSWHSRNYIRGSTGPRMLSVPVYKGVTINETRPLSDNHWRRTHLKSIELHYRKRPFFKDYFPEIETAIMQPAKSLSDLNIGLIHILMHMLDIDTPTYRSENFNIRGAKTKMLANMCKKMDVTDYLSSPGETYVKPEEMNGYAHHFLKFTHPIYDQGNYKEFMPNLSVIDLLFNMGPASGKIIREAGQ